MKLRFAFLFGVALLCGSVFAEAEKAEVRRETIRSGGRERSSWLFVPEAATADAPRPRTPIDPRRVFLFGHSAGACFALEMGALEASYFAAVAIHAGATPPENFGTFDWARRKVPYGIWIGTRDAYFPLDAVRATGDALKSRGFPVEYQEMAGHTHDYYGNAKEINRMAWEFFKPRALTADAQYTPYGESR